MRITPIGLLTNAQHVISAARRRRPLRFLILACVIVHCDGAATVGQERPAARGARLRSTGIEFRFTTLLHGLRPCWASRFSLIGALIQTSASAWMSRTQPPRTS